MIKSIWPDIYLNVDYLMLIWTWMVWKFLDDFKVPNINMVHVITTPCRLTSLWRRWRRKRSAIGRPTKKAGAKPRGQQDVVRDRNRQERVTAVDHALDLLTNPFDHMSLDQKKELALFRFYRQLKVKIIVHQSCFTMQRLLNRRHSAQARHTCLLQLASLLRLRRRWG